MTATMKDVSLTKLAVRAAGLERKEPQRYAAGAPASTPVSNASISSSVALNLWPNTVRLRAASISIATGHSCRCLLPLPRL